MTAPIDGRASRALITSGNLVTAGDSASVLTTLVSQKTVYVYLTWTSQPTFTIRTWPAAGSGCPAIMRRCRWRLA